MHLVQAPEGRRVLDRIIGFTVTSLVKNISGKLPTAGRVQSLALRLVVEREVSIKNFKSTTHYGVVLVFDAVPSVSDGWKATWNPKNWLAADGKYIMDKNLAQKIASLCDLTVKCYEESSKNQGLPDSFIISTFQ